MIFVDNYCITNHANSYNKQVLDTVGSYLCKLLVVLAAAVEWQIGF